MKKFLIISVILFFAFSVYSQQLLELYSMQDSLLSNGDTIRVLGSPQSSELVSYIKVKNISTHTVEVKCRKWVINSIPGTNNVFCWASLCYPPNVFESQVMYIQGNTVVSDFSGHYYPNGIAGVSVILYTFDPRGGDTAWIYVKYDATGQNVNANALSQLHKPFPNPASKEVYVPFNLTDSKNACIDVYDVLGRKVYSQCVCFHSGFVTIPLHQFKEGMYFIQLISDGQVVGTEKIIVKK